MRSNSTIHNDKGVVNALATAARDAAVLWRAKACVLVSAGAQRALAHVDASFRRESQVRSVSHAGLELLETSMLVLFKKRTTKTAIATAVAVSSLTIAQKYKPWRANRTTR